MSVLFEFKGKTRDDVTVELIAFESNKDGVKGVPVKLKVGMDPSIPCTLYFNTSGQGKVFAELRGPIPKVDESGKPILNLKDGRELYDFVTYKNPSTGKDTWVDAPLGSFSVMESKEKGSKYVMGKLYVTHVHLDMARLLYAIKNPSSDQTKEKSIAELNAIQSDRNNTYLVNMFPANGNTPQDVSVKNASKLFNDEITGPKKRAAQSQSPTP